MPCTAASLLATATAAGYEKLSARGLLECIVVSACAAGAAFSSAGGVLQDATGSPPPDPTKPWISFPTGGGGVSEWDVASQTWI